MTKSGASALEMDRFVPLHPCLLAGTSTLIISRHTLRLLVLLTLCIRPCLAQVPTVVTVLAQARASRDGGDLRRAVEFARQAQSLAGGQRLQDRLARLECFDLLADIYLASGRMLDAEQAGVDHLRLMQQSNVGNALAQREEVQRSLTRLGEIETGLGKLTAARGHYLEALNTPAGLRDTDLLWEPQLLWRIGSLAAIDRRVESREYFQRAATLVRGVLARYQKRIPPASELEAAIALDKQLNLTIPAPAEAVQDLVSWPDRVSGDAKLCASVLIHLIECQRAAGRDEAAKIACHRAAALLQALPDEQDNRLEVGRLLVRLADQCDSDADLAKSLRSRAAQVLELLVARRQAVSGAPTATGAASRLVRAECYDLLHQLYQRMGQWARAVEALNHLHELESGVLLADDPRLYRLRSLLGACYLHDEKLDAARPWLEDSERFFSAYCRAWSMSDPRHAGANAPADVELELAATRVNLAHVYETSRFQQSLDLLTQAEASYRRLAPDDIRRAECLINLAEKTAAVGHFDVAEQQYRNAIEIVRRAKVQTTQLDEILSVAQLNLAMLYKSQNQLAAALRLCEEALSSRKQRAPAEKDLIPCYAACAALRVAIYQQHKAAGKPSPDLLQAAVTDARTAQRLLDLHGLTQTADAAAVDYTLALALESESQNATPPAANGEAEALWKEARLLAERANRPLLQIRCLNRLVELEAKRDLGQAEELSRQALELQERVAAYPAIRFNALFNAAQIVHTRGRQSEAIELLERAIQLVETPRAFTTGAESERANYLAQFQRAFDLLFAWQAEAGDHLQALVTHELRHNRTFLEEVLAADVDVREGIDADLLRAADAATSEYYLKYSQLRLEESNIRGIEEHVRDNLNRWRRELDELAENHRHKIAEIRRASRFYQDLRTPPSSEEVCTTVNHAVEELLADQGAALFYYVGQARSHLLFAWAAPEPRFEHYALKLSAEDAKQFGLTGAAAVELGERTLLGLVNQAVDALSQPAISFTSSQTGPNSTSPAPLSEKQLLILADLMVPPALRQKIAELKPKSLAVIPDGALEKLPLEALPCGNSYLIDVLPPLHYLPSARIAAALSQPGPAATAGDFLTVAPEYRPGSGFAPLKRNTAESNAVAAALTKANRRGTQLLGPAATENHVVPALRGKSFIHLAAHAQVSDHDDQHDNLFGFIALTQTAPAAGNAADGRLTLAEVRQLDLRACELMALSACETNCGPDRPLEAGSTLARACFAAGAQRVVCSQWTTDDAASELLMAKFFGGIGNALADHRPPDYARALYEAKLAVRAAGWQSPKYWAPLILVGPARGKPTAEASSPVGQASSLPGNLKSSATSHER